MATTTITEPTTVPTAFERQRYRVETSKTWPAGGPAASDLWVQRDYLEAVDFSEVLGPGIPKATLNIAYGEVVREGSSTFATASPFTEILGHYIRIVQLGQAADETTGQEERLEVARWYGVVSRDVRAIRPTETAATIASGDQQLVAYGLIHALDRAPLWAGWGYDETDAGVVQLGYMPGVQADRGRLLGQPAIVGNRSAAKHQTTASGTKTAYLFGGPSGQAWTIGDVVEYLLANHNPTGLEIALGGQASTLDLIAAPTISLERRTVLQVLRSLLDRRRGLLFSLRVAADEKITLHISTTVTEEISAGDFKIPANKECSSLSLEDQNTFTRGIVTLDISTRYESVLVLGQRIRSTFTVSAGAAGEIAIGWAAADAVDYLAGDAEDASDDPETNDLARLSSKYWAVFRRFILPDSWDLKTASGSTASSAVDRAIFPAIADDGAVSFPATEVDGEPIPQEAAPIARGHYRLLPWLQHKVTNAAAGETVERYVRPFALFKHPDEPQAGTGVVWVRGDQLSNIELVSKSLRLDDEGLAFELSGGAAHTLAAGHWYDESPAPASSKTAPEIDYQTMIATLSAEGLQRLRYRLKFVKGADPERELVIHVPSAALHYIVEGTVLDVQDGKLVRQEAGTNADQTPRNDVEKLRQVAVLARAWYSQARSAVQIRIADTAAGSLRPGSILRYIFSSSSATWVEAFTPVSSVIVNVREGSTAIKTGYFEPDLVAAAGQTED